MSNCKIFNYTGAEEVYVVPDGIYIVHVELNGARGGNGKLGGPGGLGGSVTANLNVVPGSLLYIYVGEQGKNGTTFPNAQLTDLLPGGFNGGGHAGAFGDQGGSGGGASDIRMGGRDISNRVIVAGGGGGGGSDPAGGGGGNGTGQNGADDTTSGNQKGGTGGTQTGGGLGGTNISVSQTTNGYDGTFGLGGVGGITNYAGFDGGGGGGGGYYGGGGGAASTSDSPGDAGGGGGGSSYAYELANEVEFKQAINNGDGMVAISYVIPSWICFVANTMIQTDQGEVPIQLIKSTKHTISGSRVIGITKTIHNEKELVMFEKDSIGTNIPSRDTTMSRRHKIILRGKYIKAEDMVNNHTIRLVPYEDTFMYNIVMDIYGVVRANNLKAETLHPRNRVATMFKKHIWKTTQLRKIMRSNKQII